MQHGAWPGNGFVTSASSDRGLALWTPAGAHVGDFGQQQPWDFKDSTTWKSNVACPAVQTEQTEVHKPAVQQHRIQHADTCDAAVASLLCEPSELSDVSSVYSSGDELLSECLKEPSTDK